ncbi:MAG: hypothetical protein U0744_02650 [Gemmataceae bacterium]
MYTLCIATSFLWPLSLLLTWYIAQLRPLGHEPHDPVELLKVEKDRWRVAAMAAMLLGIMTVYLLFHFAIVAKGWR